MDRRDVETWKAEVRREFQKRSDALEEGRDVTARLERLAVGISRKSNAKDLDAVKAELKALLMRTFE